jgi:hypothetical protein
MGYVNSTFVRIGAQTTRFYPYGNNLLVLRKRNTL